jgi:two-component system NtrC family response regulator
VILASDAYIRPDDLELEEPTTPATRSLQDVRDDAERALIVEALTRNAGNISRAARDIEVSRPTFHDLLRKHGIDAHQYRKPDLETGDHSPEATAESA